MSKSNNVSSDVPGSSTQESNHPKAVLVEESSSDNQAYRQRDQFIEIMDQIYRNL
mgnify:CR=1 FL=1